MLKKTITYKNLFDNEVTKDFYFNLNTNELFKLEVEDRDGYESFITRMIAAENNREMLREFERLIRASYGVRSEDGDRFIKDAEGKTDIVDSFVQRPAFEELFIMFITEENFASEFIAGVLPANLDDVAEKLNARMKAQAEAEAALKGAQATAPPA